MHAVARIASSTPLAFVTFCVIDIETTGGSGADSITEVGAMKVCGGEVQGTFQTLLACAGPIPPEITHLTGITTAMVDTAPPIGQVLANLVEFVHGSVLVGHNVRFDLRFLEAELQRAGYPSFGCPVIDTLALARRLVRDETDNCRLGTLAEALQLDHRPTHRAFTDVLATVDLLHLLIERASGYGVDALDDLLAFPRTAGHRQAAKLRMIRRMPRVPGVVIVHGGRDQVIHLDTATNLRRRARSWFASRDGRRIGPMLREAQRFSWVETPDRETAMQVASTMHAEHRPRYPTPLAR